MRVLVVDDEPAVRQALERVLRRELGRLGASFNEMLHASRTAQRQLVADASHELRTPLTSVRANVELLAAARDNVAAGLLYAGVTAAERRRRAGETLERVGLGHRLGHPSNALSGGERQRVAIARALIARPALVLADEPTGNLDSVTGAEIMDLLHDLNRDGTTILLITHDREIAAGLRRRVDLRDGRIECDTALVAA